MLTKPKPKPRKFTVSDCISPAADRRVILAMFKYDVTQRDRYEVWNRVGSRERAEQALADLESLGLIRRNGLYFEPAVGETRMSRAQGVEA